MLDEGTFLRYWFRLLRDEVCPRCGAGVDEPCITRTGRVAQVDHSARFELARDRAIADVIEHGPQWVRQQLRRPDAQAQASRPAAGA